MTNAATQTFFDFSTTNNSTRGVISVAGKDSSGNAVTVKIGGFGDTNRGEIFTHSNHGLGFATNNAATQMTLDTSGRLLLGTTSAYSATGGGTMMVSVKGDGASRTDLSVSNQSSVDNASAAVVLATHGQDYILEATGSGNTTDGVRAFRILKGTSERLRIDTNGDLNLGNNPTNQYGYKLNIEDSAIIYAQTASSGGLEAKWHLDNSADLMEFGTVTTDALAFVTNNTPKLRIASKGGHKITCVETYYAANLTECNTGQLALNINQTRQGQTKGIALGAIGNGVARTGIQCYDTSDNSANTLLLNPFGGRVAVNVSGEPSAQFEVANDSTTGQLHEKHGWASRRFFSLPIINNEARWYKIVNYAAGNMLIGSLQIYTTRQGGFNQTKGYNEWKVSYCGFSDSIYGTAAENTSFQAGTGNSVDIVTGDSPKNVYIKIPGSIYGGYVYMIFEGIINNWQLDGDTYLTSAPS